MRETARFQCLWAEYNTALEKVKAVPDAAAKAAAAKENAASPADRDDQGPADDLGNLARHRLQPGRDGDDRQLGTAS